MDTPPPSPASPQFPALGHPQGSWYTGTQLSDPRQRAQCGSSSSGIPTVVGPQPRTHGAGSPGRGMRVRDVAWTTVGLWVLHKRATREWAPAQESPRSGLLGDRPRPKKDLVAGTPPCSELGGTPFHIWTLRSHPGNGRTGCASQALRVSGQRPTRWRWRPTPPWPPQLDATTPCPSTAAGQGHS